MDARIISRTETNSTLRTFCRAMADINRAASTVVASPTPANTAALHSHLEHALGAVDRLQAAIEPTEHTQ